MRINIFRIKLMKKTAIISSVLLATPFVAFAQALSPIYTLVGSIANLVGMLVPLAIGIALLTFFYGLIRYVLVSHKGAEQAKNSKSVMIWGLVALFVMVSVWGIVYLAQNALGIQRNVVLPAPSIPGFGAPNVPTGSPSIVPTTST